MKIIYFIIGTAIIVGCYYLGTLLSYLIGGFISSSVMGMLVLFILLQSKIIKREWVDSMASLFLDNLMLFFIPVTAGVALLSFSSIKYDLPAIILSVAVSSFLVLWVVGVIIEKFDGRGDVE